jgi:hypothetical protein
MGFLLFIIASLLTLLFGWAGLIYSLFTNNIGKYFKQLAVALDQFDNVLMQDLFNLIMIKRGGAKFGKEDETISIVVGKNLKTNTLTCLGWLIAKTLNKIETQHTDKAIEEDELDNTK